MLKITNNNQTIIRTVPLEYPIEHPMLEYPTAAHRYGTDTSIKKIVDNSQVPGAS